jgi:hypothetical protein
MYTTAPGPQGERSRTCTASLAGGPLTCVRQADHAGGHEYHALHGSWVDDRHSEGGHG